MQIHGLQKMTLLDYPEHVACTVFLAGCDLRCPFCHNFELVENISAPVMDSEELLRFLAKRKGLLDGVAFTGGEPCMHPDLPELLRSVKDLGYPVKLDTNGMHPDLLEKLLREQLVDYVAMDIKNSPEKYAMTAGLPALDLSRIRQSVDLLLSSSAFVEFRTTVIAEFHTVEDFSAIAQWIHGARRYALQCFTDRDSVPYAGLSAPAKEDLLSYAEILRPSADEVVIRGIDL